MNKYYKILGISENSSIPEIKRAFRKKAKTTHPDLNSNKTNEMSILVEAYQYVLKERKKRENFFAAFDFFSQKNKPNQFNYRDWLKNRSDYKSRANLIFFDLFNGNEKEAVNEYYERKNEAGGFYLQNYFNREDFMDCGFVLAEELYFRNDHYEAFLLLEKIFYLEQEKPYFKHFFPEVIILIKSIIRDKINKFIDDDLALECYEAALNFKLNKSDNANIYRRLSEIYYRFGDIQTSKEYLNEAIRLSPKITGIKILKQKLEAL